MCGTQKMTVAVWTYSEVGNSEQTRLDDWVYITKVLGNKKKPKCAKRTATVENENSFIYWGILKPLSKIVLSHMMALFI